MTSTQNIRLIAANGSAGVFVLIRCSMMCRAASIIEDGSANSGTGQGIQYFIPNPFSATETSVQPVAWDTILPQTEPIILGGTNATQGELGSVLGSGPQDSPGAGVQPFLGTPMIWVRSASATPIMLRVTESA